MVDTPTLMLQAFNFYKNKCTRSKWEQSSEQQREVLALQAQVKPLQKKASRKVTFEKGTQVWENHHQQRQKQNNKSWRS